MTMLETFIKPMHKEGIRFVAAFAAATVLLVLLWEPLGWLGVIAVAVVGAAALSIYRAAHG